MEETLFRKYWKGDDIEEFVTDSMIKESKVTSSRIARLHESTQTQLDELFFKHVAVPGLVNPCDAAFTRLDSGTPSPLSMDLAKKAESIPKYGEDDTNEEDIRSAMGSGQSSRPRATIFEKYLVKLEPEQRSKLEDNYLTKFKGRKGRYALLPLWVTNFEQDTNVGLENIYSGMKANGQKLKTDLDQRLLEQIEVLEGRVRVEQDKQRSLMVEKMN